MNGAVPPTIVKVTVPLFAEHVTSDAIAEAVGPATSIITSVIVALHKFESVTITVYEPVLKLLMSSVVYEPEFQSNT